MKVLNPDRAISYDGTLWRLDNNPYRWTQI